MIDLNKIDRDKLARLLTEALRDPLKEAIMSVFHVDEQGRLWVVDEKGNKIEEIEIIDDSAQGKTYDDRKAIEEASKMSLQKKEERLVINLPAWLKDRLKKKSNRTGKSMNEIIRIALTEYLSK
jgi:hypothetical protein